MRWLRKRRCRWTGPPAHHAAKIFLSPATCPYNHAMPFDVREFPGAPPSDWAARPASRRLIAGWLFGIDGMVLVMIPLGGAPGLTVSGLSITEWDPLIGGMPPLSDAEWHRLFALYQQIPQYHLV